MGEAQQVFLKSDLKNLIQKLRVGTNSPCLLRLQTQKLSEEKVTVRFKLNLKTDGLDYKMIFKFGKRIERLHSCSKQCLRIYKDHFCVAKILVGNTQTLELHRADAGCAISLLLLYRYGFTDGEEYLLIGTAIYFHLTKGRAKKTEGQAMDNLWLELPWWFD